MTATPGPLFALALASISLIGPLAVHLFLPVIPAVKAALGLSEATAQLTFSIALFGMAFATLFYGSLSDRSNRRRGFGGGRFDRAAGARPVPAGGRRRLRHHARPRHRARRLRPRPAGQG